MRLDHFVIHVDNDEQKLANLAEAASEAGIPCNFKRNGKGTKGFQARNIWLGRQYFEIVYLRRPDGGGWRDKWVSQYNRGERGVVCLFVRVSNLAALKNELSLRNVEAVEEKVSFKLFGLFKVTMPWTSLHLTNIPGTGFEISFIEYGQKVTDSWYLSQKPNAIANGFEGISSCTIELPETRPAIAFLKKVFPSLVEQGNEAVVPLEQGCIKVVQGKNPKVTLNAETSRSDLVGRSFAIENTLVQVTQSVRQ
jgi:hypothetical protein